MGRLRREEEERLEGEEDVVPRSGAGEFAGEDLGWGGVGELEIGEGGVREGDGFGGVEVGAVSGELRIVNL
jgi:hypothetical protein